MKKVFLRTFSIFLALCLLLSVTSFAEEIMVDRNSMDVVLNSGDVVADMQYSYSGHEYDENFVFVNNVVVNADGEEPVIIGRWAFSPNSVKSLTINGTGEVIIKEGAFSFTRLSSLELPANVIIDGNGVFSDSDIETVRIACNICPYMFDYCQNLKSVTFVGDNITEIPAHMFFSCEKLQSIEIPSSVIKIGEYAFCDCNLKAIEIPSSVNEILYRAFFTNDLETIYIPSSVEKIGKESFSDNDFIEVKLNEGLKTIGEEAFYANEQLKEITIPASVTEIGEKAFGYKLIDALTGEKVDGFTIYGYRGTEAERYAKENEFTFIPLDDNYDNVIEMSYTPTWSEINDYSFTVADRAEKVQIIEANEATRTFSRNAASVSIKSYDAEGNEVDSLSRTLDHEVWTIHSRLTPDSDLRAHAKYGGKWDEDTYNFRVTTLASDKTFKSAELTSDRGAKGKVDCKIVTGSGVLKARVEYEDGETSTYSNSFAELDAENQTYTYNIKVNAAHDGENCFKIYYKTQNGWQYATTLNYTAE